MESINKPESELSETLIMIEALKTEKDLAITSNNQIKVNECSKEIHRLN